MLVSRFDWLIEQGLTSLPTQYGLNVKTACCIGYLGQNTTDSIKVGLYWRNTEIHNNKNTTSAQTHKNTVLACWGSQ